MRCRPGGSLALHESTHQDELKKEHAKADEKTGGVTVLDRQQHISNLVPYSLHSDSDDDGKTIDDASVPMPDSEPPAKRLKKTNRKGAAHRRRYDFEFKMNVLGALEAYSDENSAQAQVAEMFNINPSNVSKWVSQRKAIETNYSSSVLSKKKAVSSVDKTALGQAVGRFVLYVLLTFFAEGDQIVRYDT